MKCEWKERVLQYLKGDDQDLEIEKHLEHCEQCQALMEGYLAREEAIKLPEAECTKGNLKEQVEHYDKGTRRILVFTIVGLIMGWFSYMYYGTDFLPLKILIGIPYKMNEMLHTALHNHNLIYLTKHTQGLLNEFFPQAYLVSVIAEYGISSLIGGALYGSLGFFTGDKRIFTLTKYIKFSAVWICIISLSIAGTFLANNIAVEKNQKFEDISGFFLYYESGGSGFYHDSPGASGDCFKSLEQAFYADGKVTEIENQQRNMEEEELIEFTFGPYHTRYMAAFINLQEKYLVTDIGKMYPMSDEFCQTVLACQEKEEKENAKISN